MFQFTHPGKGATPFWGASLVILASFNSRTLGRVRPDDLTNVVAYAHVSIHAPWEGCDLAVSAGSYLTLRVSIHAPWEGCDVSTVT